MKKLSAAYAKSITNPLAVVDDVSRHTIVVAVEENNIDWSFQVKDVTQDWGTKLKIVMILNTHVLIVAPRPLAEPQEDDSE
ncbi:hypothetical protein QVD17_19322 [Tagetes erecta]|uniref:Uncharacterized protein n=1 Tax=Tagetes erecta TaxID=13708 RepID=A0AAD8KME6_TARER|nr:hypothetical protein QVD17_19322 [Tagetes erecta]